MKIKNESKEIFKLDNVNIFAAIVFTDKDEYLSKILTSKEESHFVDALNAITGESIYVFSIKLEYGKYDFPTLPRGAIGYMAPVWKEPKKNSLFLAEFGLNSSEEFPIILFWCFDENGEAIQKSFSLSNKYKSVDEAYLDLKKYLNEASDTINEISKENLHTTNVLRNVSGAMDTLEKKKFIISLFEKLKKGYEILSFIKP